MAAVIFTQQTSTLHLADKLCARQKSKFLRLWSFYEIAQILDAYGSTFTFG